VQRHSLLGAALALAVGIIAAALLRRPPVAVPTLAHARSAGVRSPGSVTVAEPSEYAYWWN
jgi:uncharacterized protein (DUF362 family)